MFKTISVVGQLLYQFLEQTGKVETGTVEVYNVRTTGSFIHPSVLCFSFAFLILIPCSAADKCFNRTVIVFADYMYSVFCTLFIKQFSTQH